MTKVVMTVCAPKFISNYTNDRIDIHKKILSNTVTSFVLYFGDGCN